jgi:hypothetical protein
MAGSAAETGEACRALVRFLETRRWPLSDEKRLQEAVADELTANGFEFEREVTLARGDVIDFMVGNIGMELKIKGQRRAIYRQCERYCLHERVQGLVLASAVAMGVPAFVNCKPLLVAHLGVGGL